MVLRREPCCRVCAELGVDTLAVDVDHVTPLSAGGSAWSMANLQPLCRAHHTNKTRHWDMKGRAWSEWQQRGCNADGTPRDPAHPWHASADAAVGGDDSSSSPAFPTGTRT